jgi:hypothetical protein
VVYVLKFRVKEGHTKISRTLFAEASAQPTREKAVELLSSVTGGDFVEDTIEIRELRDFDPIEIRGQGATVFTL